MNLEQVLQTGGALAILGVIVIAFYRNNVQTTAAVEKRIGDIVALWSIRFSDERAEKEAWKAQAQTLAPAVAKIAEELELANERDEKWKKFIADGLADRRQDS